MTQKARQRALQDSYATVDGIPFKMPINSLNSPALMVGFTVDYAQTAALLPGEEIKLVKLPRGRALMIITVIDYKKTDIGSYIEFSIAFACYHKRAGARFMGTFLAERTSAVGQYVWDLPVSTEISVKGGKGIWGMPKHQANLDFDVTPDQMSSQYDLDGELCMRITVPAEAAEDPPARLRRHQLLPVSRHADEVQHLLLGHRRGGCGPDREGRVHARPASADGSAPDASNLGPCHLRRLHARFPWRSRRPLRGLVHHRTRSTRTPTGGEVAQSGCRAAE